jgi:hypothetical protein
MRPCTSTLSTEPSGFSAARGALSRASRFPRTAPRCVRQQLANLALILTSFAFAGCSSERTGTRAPARPPAVSVGTPESCVPLSNLRETRIRDDWTIDFIGNGRVWRNTLRDRCPGLKSNNRFSYQTSLYQLCSTDPIFVLDLAGNLQRGASCGLGPFVPVVLRE